MITGTLKNSVDRLWNIFWSGGIANTLDVIEQMTYLIFIRDLDDMDSIRSKDAIMCGMPHESIFGPDNEVCKWSVFRHMPAAEMYDTLQNRVEELNAKGTGSTFKAISKSILENIEIPLPPLSVQKQIADVLDRTARLRELRSRQLEKMDLLIKSKFIDMFGDPVTNSMGWEMRLLNELCSKIGSGATPRGGQKSYKNCGVSLIRSMNIHNGCFKYKNLAFIDDAQAEQLDNVVLQENDVLIDITGASVARSCLVPHDILPARVNQHVSILRCIQRTLNHYFLNHLLISDSFQRELLSIGGAGGAGGATREAITKQQLENLNIPLPPLSLQLQFADFVARAEEQKAAMRRGLEGMEMNCRALMQEYFG